MGYSKCFAEPREIGEEETPEPCCVRGMALQPQAGEVECETDLEQQQRHHRPRRRHDGRGQQRPCDAQQEERSHCGGNVHHFSVFPRHEQARCQGVGG